jgi:hypothetical protein
MTLSTVAPGYSCGISYSSNTWCCWTQPTGAPERYRAHVGHTRDSAIDRAENATSKAVGDALRRLGDPPESTARSKPQDPRPKPSAPKKERSAPVIHPPGSVFGCYTVIRHIRDDRPPSGKLIHVYEAKCPNGHVMERSSQVLIAATENWSLGCPVCRAGKGSNHTKRAGNSRKNPG